MTALSADEIEAFVRDGHLLLRGCFDPAHAAELARRSLVLRAPPPVVRRRTNEGLEDVDATIDLLDPSTWGGTRLDVVAGLGLSIAELSPRLWGAIRSLLGGREPSRTPLGEQWILNGNYVDGGGEEDPGDLGWHIDTPGTDTTFEDRYDALVLLVLWSDVVPGGGGPYYSGRSLDLVVQAIDASPAGIDTTGRAWARAIGARVGDGRELTGRAGDVLVTHPFSLHAASKNRARRVRVLENPTITVSRALDYSHENDRPCAVEAAVIRRRAPRPVSARHEGFAAAAAWLITRHPDYFLPLRGDWEARVDEEERARVHALDVALHEHVVTRAVRRIARTRPDPLAAALGCVAAAREAVVNQRVVHADLRESLHDPDFARTGFARLVRGFVTCEGQSWLLLGLLRHFFPGAELFETLDPDTGRSSHTLVLVETDGGWFFADAWSDFPLFHVNDRGGTPLAGVPEHGTLDARGPLSSHGLHPRSHFARGCVERCPAAKPGALEAPSSGPPRARSAWGEYLEVRVSDLTGKPDAASRYAALLERHRLGGLTGQVVRALHARARSAP